VGYWHDRLERIEQLCREILRRLPPITPTHIALGNPVAFRKDGTVANYQLLDDTVAYFPVVTLDAEGNPVPPQSGDTFSVALTAPTGASPTAVTASIGVMPGTTNPAVVLTPAVQNSPGWSFTVTDADGLPAISEGFDIVADVAPKSIEINVAGVVTQPQSPPTAPGP
jgi:hypothetical protein